MTSECQGAAGGAGWDDAYSLPDWQETVSIYVFISKGLNRLKHGVIINLKCLKCRKNIRKCDRIICVCVVMQFLADFPPVIGGWVFCPAD